MSDGMLAFLIFSPIGCLALIGLAAVLEVSRGNRQRP